MKKEWSILVFHLISGIFQYCFCTYEACRFFSKESVGIRVFLLFGRYVKVYRGVRWGGWSTYAFACMHVIEQCGGIQVKEITKFTCTRSFSFACSWCPVIAMNSIRLSALQMLLVFSGAWASHAACDDGSISFNRDVRPILILVPSECSLTYSLYRTLLLGPILTYSRLIG